jgi:predicted Zn-ribbon and HTH transcriptional regulator
MTTKELTVAVTNLGQAVNHMSTLVANDIQQIMGVLAGLLDHQGLLEHFKCPSCGEALSHPKLDGIQRPTACPKCQSEITEEDLANMSEEE